MSQSQPILSADLVDEIGDQVRIETPEGIIEAIAIQMHTAREARGRIEREGSVVRDARGSVIPHPAIKIESDAIKLYTALLAKWYVFT